MELLPTIGFICALVLEGIGMYVFHRRKLAELQQELENIKKTAAESEKLIAEKNNIIEKTKGEVILRDKQIAEKDRTIAERDRTIAETKILTVDVQKRKLELRSAQFKVQQDLTEENRKYKQSQDDYTECLFILTNKCLNQDDASSDRKNAISILINSVLFSYSNYIESASTLHSDDPSHIKASLIKTEVISFLLELSDSVNILNSNDVLQYCNSFSEPLQITDASLGAIERACIMLLDGMDIEHIRIIAPEFKQFSTEGWMITTLVHIDNILKAEE